MVNFGAKNGTNISYVVTFYSIWKGISHNITNVSIGADTLNGTAVIDKHYFMDRVGIYNVKITAINFVTPLQSLTRTVIVDKPIRNVEVEIHDFVETNHTVNYTITANASNVTITWDFKDPASGELNFRTRWFPGVFSGWTVSHKFIESGHFFIEVTLNNSLENNYLKRSLGKWVERKSVNGQHGVYLATVTNSPQPLPPGNLTFTFFPEPGVYYWHPTDAHMIMHFGDGKIYNGSYNSTIVHSYTSWGWFTVNCSIYNRISSGNFTFNVEIQRVILDLKLTPFHSGGDAGYFAPGRGKLMNYLPLEYDVIWNVTTSDGTNITYTFSYGDGDRDTTTQNATVTHKYSRDEFFTARVHASNAVSFGSTTFTIRIQKVVRGITITSDDPRKLNTSTSFNITIDQVGTESCYLMRFGKDDDKNYLYKDANNTNCEKDFISLANETFILKGNLISVNYTYTAIDVYWPRVIGSNLVSKIEQFHKSVVLSDDCRYPVVNVFNINKNKKTPTKVLRSQFFFVDTANKIVCAASKTTSFLWEVFNVNPLEGENDTLTNFSSSVERINPRLVHKIILF